MGGWRLEAGGWRSSPSVNDKGHRSFNRTNPYFTKDDPSLPEDDPRRAFYDRSNNFISADNFSHEGPLRAIHDFPAFDPFIRDCLQEEKFYRYADPLADVIINMAEEGGGFPWHFDTNNFTVTLAIQNAECGGEFEYAPNIRTGGEKRISNFILWQLAYCEFYFTDALWPDFDKTLFQEAIDSFFSRQRRFGRTGDQLKEE